MSAPSRENHRYAVRMARALDTLVRDEKARWLAHVTGISESVLSECRNGSRNLPAYRVPIVDEAMNCHALLKEMALMEGCGIYELDPSPMSASDLERIYPQILREEGTANADIFDALVDGELDDAERERIHAHAAKLRHFFQELEDRTSPNEKAAPGRTA